MEQDRQLSSYFEGLARAASSRGGARFSRFLDPAQRLPAQIAARRQSIAVEFFGGYGEAERTIAAFYGPSGKPPAVQWPLLCLKAVWSRHAAPPAHRDLLGAQMALGLDRDCFGDILTGCDGAYLFVAREVASYVLANFIQAGRTPLTLTVEEGPLERLPQPQGRSVRVTVMSMRLDAMTAAAWNLNRAQAQSLIQREQVKLNHLPCDSCDTRVEAGDLISARGLGRARVSAPAIATRKGRLAVELFLYGNN